MEEILVLSLSLSLSLSVSLSHTHTQLTGVSKKNSFLFLRLSMNLATSSPNPSSLLIFLMACVILSTSDCPRSNTSWGVIGKERWKSRQAWYRAGPSGREVWAMLGRVRFKYSLHKNIGYQNRDTVQHNKFHINRIINSVLKGSKCYFLQRFVI